MFKKGIKAMLVRSTSLDDVAGYLRGFANQSSQSSDLSRQNNEQINAVEVFNVSKPSRPPRVSELILKHSTIINSQIRELDHIFTQMSAIKRKLTKSIAHIDNDVLIDTATAVITDLVNLIININLCKDKIIIRPHLAKAWYLQAACFLYIEAFGEKMNMSNREAACNCMNNALKFGLDDREDYAQVINTFYIKSYELFNVIQTSDKREEHIHRQANKMWKYDFDMTDLRKVVCELNFIDNLDEQREKTISYLDTVIPDLAQNILFAALDLDSSSHSPRYLTAR